MLVSEREVLNVGTTTRSNLGILGEEAESARSKIFETPTRESTTKRNSSGMPTVGIGYLYVELSSATDSAYAMVRQGT
jgi:hypothetical protein